MRLSAAWTTVGDMDWTGNNTIEITSIPNPNDVSTWTWTAEFTGSLVIPIPEPGMGSLVLIGCGIFAAGCVFRSRRARSAA